MEEQIVWSCRPDDRGWKDLTKILCKDLYQLIENYDFSLDFLWIFLNSKERFLANLLNIPPRYTKSKKRVFRFTKPFLSFITHFSLKLLFVDWNYQWSFRPCSLLLYSFYLKEMLSAMKFFFIFFFLLV